MAKKIQELGYWIAVVIIFALAALLRFRLPLDPLIVPNYLLPALKKLVGPEFGQVHFARTIIYPGFVYLLMRVFGGGFATSFRIHVYRTPFTAG